MTSLARFLCIVSAALIFFGAIVYAEDPPAAADQAAPRVNVRIEVLMVAMPGDKFITLLPDLQDDAKIGAAVDELLAGVKRKEFILRGYPMVITIEGQRSISESLREINYVGEAPPAATPAPTPVPDSPPAKPVDATPTPTPAPDATPESKPSKAMLSRQMGVSMETEPAVQKDGLSVYLGIDVKDIQLADEPANKGGAPSKGGGKATNDPLFDIVDVRTWFTLRSGQYKLLTTQKISKPEGYVEVFVVRAVVMPSKKAGDPPR